MKPWQKQCWCIPPQADAAFVHNMEDVLEVYHRPPDDLFPVVCVDETSKQLVSETRVPQPPAPGQPLRYDYEYRRNAGLQPIHDHGPQAVTVLNVKYGSAW